MRSGPEIKNRGKTGPNSAHLSRKINGLGKYASQKDALYLLLTSNQHPIKQLIGSERLK
jgi:hypothetical protein